MLFDVCSKTIDARLVLTKATPVPTEPPPMTKMSNILFDFSFDSCSSREGRVSVRSKSLSSRELPVSTFTEDDGKYKYDNAAVPKIAVPISNRLKRKCLEKWSRLMFKQIEPTHKFPPLFLHFCITTQWYLLNKKRIKVTSKLQYLSQTEIETQRYLNLEQDKWYQPDNEGLDKTRNWRVLNWKSRLLLVHCHLLTIATFGQISLWSQLSFDQFNSFVHSIQRQQFYGLRTIFPMNLPSSKVRIASLTFSRGNECATVHFNVSFWAFSIRSCRISWFVQIKENFSFMIMIEKLEFLSSDNQANRERERKKSSRYGEIVPVEC